MQVCVVGIVQSVSSSYMGVRQMGGDSHRVMCVCPMPFIKCVGWVEPETGSDSIFSVEAQCYLINHRF